LQSIGSETVLVDEGISSSEGRTVLRLSEGGLEAMRECAVVVKTPGISRYAPEVELLEGAGVPVVGGLGLWLEEVDRSRVLCVTGTKGKSTTTSIAAHLARGLGLRVFAGGNLGVPPFDPEAGDGYDLWVIETSSYQATDVASTPPVVAVTSLYPDHLEWHGDQQTYFRDKLSLCSQPGARLTVASGASDLLIQHEAMLGPQVEWITPTHAAAWTRPLGLPGRHNLVNAEIAGASLVALGVTGADSEEALRKAAEGFEPLDSRLESVASLAGVEFVDDSLSTNVLPTLAALDVYADRRVALIAGGFDRGIDYEPLAVALASRQLPIQVLTVYSSGPRIEAAVRGNPAELVAVRPCADLEDAVRSGWEWAKPDGVVLLSPAAASFDAFDNYRDRSAAFRAAISRLEAHESPD
jgi:UDP-N-acetylmuramoylalanine--D-glutamate ligase